MNVIGMRIMAALPLAPIVARAVIPACLLAALLMSAQVALAAKPVEHFVGRFDETFPEVVCGVSVTIHVEGKVNFLEYGGSIKAAEQIQETWTNADGDWLQLFNAGHFQGQIEEDNGVLTITEWISGIHRTSSAAGITADFGRGRIGNVIVIDLNDPETFEDDEIISFETVFSAGQHPAEDVFCEVVAGVLG
jgi:hypothetical protein